MKEDYLWIQDRLETLDRIVESAMDYNEDNKPVKTHWHLKQAKLCIKGLIEDMIKDD